MNKIAFDERGNQKIFKLLTGGLAGGTSIGLSLALANYLKDLSAETKTDTSVDDDTLYLDMPTATEPQVPGAPRRKQATVSGAVGVTAALLATLGSAAAVRQFYQKFKKRELQQQLDKAQVGYTDKVVQEAQLGGAKKAAETGTHMHPGDVASSTPLAALMLTMLASGALTYRGLNKYFPAAKKPTSVEPKRVIIRRKKTQPGYHEDPNESAIDKTASYDDLPDTDIEDDALEFVVKLAMHNPVGASDLRDVIYAVAAGRHTEICDHGLEYGAESVFDITKNASKQPINAERVNLAVTRCVKSAFLRPIIETLTCAEFYDMAPASVKAASEMSEDAQDALVKLAGLFGAGARYDFWKDRYADRFTVKEAGMLGGGMLGAANPSLENLLDDSLAYDPGADENAAQMPLLTETESEVSQSQRPEDEQKEQAKERIRVQEQQVQDEDPIDAAMSGISGGEDKWAEGHSTGIM
jgi:hypothetical protein